jgi:hypothetical protein
VQEVFNTKLLEFSVFVLPALVKQIEWMTGKRNLTSFDCQYELVYIWLSGVENFLSLS